MNRGVQTMFNFFAGSPNRIWTHAIIPLFGFVFLLCLLVGDITVFTPDQIGYRHFQEENYGAAAQRFTAPQWEAAAHYRNGEFKEAAAILGGYDTPDAAFNHGNSLVMLGKYEEAVQRYERALALKPGWQAAEVNLEIAALRAERLKTEGGDMTGGQLEADDIVFTEGKSSANQGDEAEVVSSELSDAEMRAVWLRNVQTRPADFLRSKFAYQQTMAVQPETPENEAN